MSVHPAATFRTGLLALIRHSRWDGELLCFQQGLYDFGVSDGIRTRDVQIHSLALYQAELRSPLGKTGDSHFLRL